MALRHRWLPRVPRPQAPYRREQHAARSGAARMAIAGGARTARRIPIIGPSGSPQVYSEAPRPPEPYAGPYGSPGSQVYSGTRPLPAPETYSGTHAPVSGPYAPQVYSGGPGRMRWMIGPQPYGM